MKPADTQLHGLVNAVREFTGEGMMSVKKALAATGNDPLLACGYLKYSGCLINLNGGDLEAWTLRNAEGYAKLLALAEDGRIVWRAAPESAPADASVNQTDLEGPGQ